MIERAIALAKLKTEKADALWRDEDQLELRFESGRLKETTRRQEAGLNLRVVANGRVGIAGTTDLSGEAAMRDLLARALASAAQGETCDLAMPAAAPLPSAATFDDGAAGIDFATMAAIGRGVIERLSRPGWQVSASVERYVEATRFVNSAGQEFAYRATAVSVSGEVVRIAGDDVLMAYDSVSRTLIPSDAELEEITRTVVTKMERSERVVEPPEGRLPVLFTPNGVGAVFLPIRQALSGKTVLQGVSPLGGKLGETMFASSLTVVDEPLLAGRLGTRPADDEGIPSARLPVIERGAVRAFVYDLETAARAGVRSTGHGRRATFGKPGISFSNLVIEPGTLEEAALLKEVGHGLVVDELIGVGQGNVISGAFSHPVALAWRVDGGEITGRVKDAAIAGNAYDLLKRIRAIGKDAKWKGGSSLVPPFVLDAVNVARR
jgi:PmbA protein